MVLVGSNGAGAVALDGPSGTAVDRRGDVFVADADHHRVVELDVSGAITTIAGTGTGGFSGDGGEATAAQFATPQDVAVDGLGRVYIVDRGQPPHPPHRRGRHHHHNRSHGQSGSFGDNGPAILAELDNPTSVAVDGRSGVFVADARNNNQQSTRWGRSRPSWVATARCRTPMGSRSPVTSSSSRTPVTTRSTGSTASARSP